jgi:hypothetical protein
MTQDKTDWTQPMRWEYPGLLNDIISTHQVQQLHRVGNQFIPAGWAWPASLIRQQLNMNGYELIQNLKLKWMKHCMLPLVMKWKMKDHPNSRPQQLFVTLWCHHHPRLTSTLLLGQLTKLSFIKWMSNLCISTQVVHKLCLVKKTAKCLVCNSFSAVSSFVGLSYRYPGSGMGIG